MNAPVSARRTLLRGALVISAVVSALAAMPALASAHGRGEWRWWSPPPAVYTATNNPSGNSVIVFARHSNGTLSESETVPTGGTGAADQPPFGFPVVDSSQSMRLSPGGHLLFVVNGGDNSVSSFRVTDWGLQLVSHVSSGGSLPISLALDGHLLYVLNEDSGNISGLYVSHGGHLTPIPGSSQPLSSDTSGEPANGAPAQIGFSPDGSVLNVTERLTDTIDTFRMRPNGTPGPAVPTATPTQTIGGIAANNPFGFAYQGSDHLIVTNANAFQSFVSSASSYRLTNSHSTPLTPITPIVLTNGLATCWIVITNDGRWAFMSNTVSGAGGGTDGLSTFSIAPNGSLTLAGNTSTTQGFASDLGLTPDNRYLYVVLPSNVTNPLTPEQAPAANTSQIDEYRVGPGGSLTYIGATPSSLDLPNSLSGIGVW